jgi:hypothetical protein
MNIAGKQSIPMWRMRLSNMRDLPLVVVLEPWANEYQIPPGNALDILEEGAESAEPLEVHLDGGRVVLFARPGSTLRAFLSGRELP